MLFFGLGVLHGVRGEFTDDVSETAAALYIPHIKALYIYIYIYMHIRQQPTSLGILILTHDQCRWDLQRFPKRRP
jgi:hypothetical protein